MIIALTNESSIVTDAELDLIARAVYFQCRYHFCPAWGHSVPSVVAIPKGSGYPINDILIHVRDDSTQPGALGWHSDSTTPTGYVFAKTDAQYGALLSVTISHEVLELLADPDCQRGEQHPSTGYWYALEVGDPVEADSDGYPVTIKDAAGATHTVTVSNFILPNWFKPGSPGPYDHQLQLGKPFEVRPGGYVSIWKGTGQWTQYQAQQLEADATQPDRDVWFHVVESKSPRQRVRGEL